MSELERLTELDGDVVVIASLPPEARANKLPGQRRVVVDLEWAHEAAACWPRGRRWQDYRRAFESERRKRLSEMAELLAIIESPTGKRHHDVKERLKTLLWELRRSSGTPRLTETIEDGMGAYLQRWMCEPPLAGQGFVVMREAWNATFTLRSIYEWRPWTDEDEAKHLELVKKLVPSKKEQRGD